MTELFALDLTGGFDEALADLLPPWRRERFDRLKNAAARQESLGAGLLFSAAMRRRGIDPREPVAVLGAGKPVFAARRDAYFSLSHSGRYALCAVSDKPVGADVQALRAAKLSIARRFHPDERAWLEALPEAERHEAFFRLWTRKEAWVKAVSADQMLTLSEADVIQDIPGLLFRDYTLPGEYFAALCGADAALPGDIITIERSALPTEIKKSLKEEKAL